ncbi:alpha/beta fold hydrolase [Amycolatopsis nigrescens]|uniref:alpha/beta fold hydrolase n=1 Tax=Amycolatopsis nigrescens TaxID=381445 RepID=UPI00036184DF|nr:alpha/beta hydrolase [Amycolatopsis nigrescens]
MTGISDFKTPAGRTRYFEAYDRAMRDCPEPDAALDVDSRHGTTRVYRYGQGDAPPIVLLPGLMNTSASFGPLIPALAAHRQVYAVDTLGEAGRSVQTAPFQDIPDRARCLEDVLAQLELRDVHLLGGSTGGWHAFNQAIHAPDRIASISALDPTTVTAKFSGSTQWYSVLTMVLNQDWVWRRFMRWSAGADIADRPDVRLVLAGIRNYRPRVPFQVCPSDDEIRSIRVPVLTMFGARSVVHDSAVAASRLRALLPQADVEVLPEAGHYLFLRPDDRARIVDRVLTFVQRQDQAAR